MRVDGHNKIYLSRSQTRSMSAYEPIGDAHGGAAYGERNDPVTAAVVTAGSLYAANQQSNAAEHAADMQRAAANQALQTQQDTFNTQNAQQAPYREAGYAALKDIADLKPYLQKQYGTQDFMQGIDPGYAFRLQQGEMANQRAANVSGGALSGNTLAGLNAYNSGMASQEYQNAFNRFQTERGNIYNTLASIAGLGQTAQGQTNQLAQNYATNAANLMTGSAAAQAAGTVGAANAQAGAIQNATNTYALSSMMNRGNPAATSFNQNTGWANGGSGQVNVPGEGSMSIKSYFTGE